MDIFFALGAIAAILLVVAFAVISLILLNFHMFSPVINKIFSKNAPHKLTRRHIAILDIILIVLGFLMVLPVQSTENINKIFDAPALFQLGGISLLVVTFLKEKKNRGTDQSLTFSSLSVIWFFGSGFIAMYLTIFPLASNIVNESAKIAIIYLGGLNLCSAGVELILVSKLEGKHGRTKRK